MKILLINNNTLHLESLNKSLNGHQVEVQVYKPGLQFNHDDKDMVILSGGGGEGLEIYDQHRPGRLWYEDEMDFVLNCDKPLIGICMGFEVICAAYGQKIYETPVLTQGFKQISATAKGRKLIGKAKLEQFESHYWQLRTAPKGFDVLAQSETGIEIIKKGNIFASQFHPEKGGSLQLERLLRSKFA
jgi:GMP synthase-like glutamine amidotransferase